MSNPKCDPKRAAELRVAQKALALSQERMSRLAERAVHVARLMAKASPRRPRLDSSGHPWCGEQIGIWWPLEKPDPWHSPHAEYDMAEEEWTIGFNFPDKTTVKIPEAWLVAADNEAEPEIEAWGAREMAAYDALRNKKKQYEEETEKASLARLQAKYGKEHK